MPSAWSEQQVAAAMRKAGFPESAIPTGVAISTAESGRAPIRSTVDNNSQGPWQINLDVHNLSAAQANDLQASTDYAYKLFQQSGWQPWSAYTTGAHQQYMGGGQPMPNPAEGPTLTKEDLVRMYGGGDAGGPSPTEGAQDSLNLRQDYAKYISDVYGVELAVAETFLRNSPDILAGLITNFDLSDKDAQSRFVKLLLEMEQKGTLGTNLGAKAGSLTTSISSGGTSSNSSTTSSRRDLTPSEAETIFKMELEWQKTQKQAPLEAAKFISSMGPGAYTPPSMAGKMMPGMEPGGAYSSLMPGMDASMFQYKGTPGVEGIQSMFEMDETALMQQARQLMQQQLLGGVGSSSITNSMGSTSGSTNQSMTKPMGGPQGMLSPLQQAAAAQGIMGNQPPPMAGNDYAAPMPASQPMAQRMPGVTANVPKQQNGLQQIWNSIFGGR